MTGGFLYFPKGDRRALLILLVVAAVVVGVNIGIYIGRGQRTEPATGAQTDTLTERMTGGGAAQQMHPFDPNTVTADELLGMGFPKQQVYALLAARERGFVFRSVYDVLSTYRWQDEDPEQLSRYVRIGPQYRKQTGRHAYAARSSYERDKEPHRRQIETDSVQAPAYPDRNKFAQHTLVDVNTADTTLLMRIPGIGPYFANQIIRYREHLGGFVNAQQLVEIPRFPEETIDWLVVRNPQPTQIYLPAASADQMGRHPYIGYRRAKAIAAYQRHFHPIRSVDELRQTRLFSEDTIQMLLPYLVWSPDSTVSR